MNKGIYQQIQEAKIENYNGLTLEKLTQSVLDISKNTSSTFPITYPDLSKEEVKKYNKLIKKIKPGYLYRIEGDFILVTGYKGAKDILKKCKKDNVPLLLAPTIWIIDDERNISAKLEDITWVKLKKLKL